MVTPPLVTVSLMSEGKLDHVTVSARAPVIARQSNAESAIAAMFIFLLVIFLLFIFSCSFFVPVLAVVDFSDWFSKIG